VPSKSTAGQTSPVIKSPEEKERQHQAYLAASALQTALKTFISAPHPDPEDVIFLLWRLRAAVTVMNDGAPRLETKV